jgi:hypothetical protein
VSERGDMIAVVSRHLARWSVTDEDLRLGEINDVYGEEIEVIEPTGLPLGPGRLGLHKHIGMLQSYWGTSPSNLTAISTPITVGPPMRGSSIRRITDGLSRTAKSSTLLMGGSCFSSW